MDVRMPNVDGIEATRRLLAADGLEMKVIMLTTFDMDEYVYDALKRARAGSCSRTSRRSSSWRDPHGRAGRGAAGAVRDAARDRRVRPPAAVVGAGRCRRRSPS